MKLSGGLQTFQQQCVRLRLTFAVGRDLHGQANDANQVLNGHQGPQDGPDPQSFTFTGLDQL